MVWAVLFLKRGSSSSRSAARSWKDHLLTRGCGIVSVSLRQEGNVCVFSSRINSAGQSEKQQAFSAERFSADEGFCFPGLDSDDQ